MAKDTTKNVAATDANGTQVEAPAEKSTAKKEKQRSVYSLNELAANARNLFNTRQECVVAALRDAGKTECTVSEAKEIVSKFLKKEVK